MRLLKHLTLAIAITCQLLIISCKKDQTINEINNTEHNFKSFPSQDSAIAYTYRNLRIIGEAILSFSDDKSFKDSCYFHVGQQFDGDNNALIKTLTDKYSYQGKSFSDIASSQLSGLYSSATIYSALMAFMNIDSRNFYPQVYIPFFQELKSQGLLGVSEPILIISAIDQPNEYSFDGFQFINGKIVKLNFKIDETFASKNEVWVISLNERVNNDGLIKEHSLSHLQQKIAKLRK